MNNLQLYRKRARMTLAELGAASGLNGPSRISNYESGLRSPGLDECRALVAALAAAGVLTDQGKCVTLDDVFPPHDTAVA